MTPATKKVILYLLLIFFVVIAGVSSFYLYNIFFVDEGANMNFLNDPEFANITNREEVETPDEYEEMTYLGCEFNGKMVSHQELRTFYTRASIGAYESCKQFARQRRCNDGQWMGNKRYEFSTCEKTLDCKLNYGVVVKNGEHADLYSRSEVPFGDDCEKYKGTRTCKESVLLGNKLFKFDKCTVSHEGVCEVDGQFLASGQAKKFYSKKEVSYQENCDDFTINRVCSSGNLFGDEEYKYLSCIKLAPKNCFTTTGVEIKHNDKKNLYSSQTPYKQFNCNYLSQERHCDNGILDGDEEYKYETCTD